MTSSFLRTVRSWRVHAEQRQLRFFLSKTDLAFLCVTAVLTALHARDFLDGNPISGLFALQQAAVLGFTLLHRPKKGAGIPHRAVLLAWAGTLLPLAMRPSGAALLPGALLIVLGSILATGAILSLGRSFGIEAANRGVQTHGLYRFVRHPIYAAYLPLIGGYLVAFPSWWNVTVFALWIAVQVARILREEAVLCLDPEYRAYAQRVRWRLIPGVW